MNQFLHRALIVVALFCAGPGSATADERLRGYGDWRGGGFFVGVTEPGSRVWFNDRPIPVDRDGYYLLGLEREAQGEQWLVIRMPDGSEQTYRPSVEARNYRIQRIDGLQQGFVTPPESALERIREEAEQVSRARLSDVVSDDWRAPFIWPVQGRITGVYGSQRILNDVPGTPHWGIDLALPTGTPVLAPAGGVVVLAEADLYFSGGTVILSHGGALASSFLHLSDIQVAVGDRLEQGDRIGAVGSTGRSTGPHLDWRINIGEVRTDAGLWVPPMNDLCEAQGEGTEAVVLLHGLGRTDRSMQSLAEQLQQAGFVTCNQGYPSRSESIQELSGYAANAVQKLTLQGYERIHLVTHSMGGILARYWLQWAQLPGDGHLVMLSPPNKGSEIIDVFGDQPWFQWLFGPAAVELGTEDTALVNRIGPINERVGIVTGSRSSDPWFNFLFEEAHDGKVSVSSARLSEADGFRVVASGHTFIMNDQTVRDLVVEFLRNGHFSSE
ncbi:MAG: alpha/beta fold hydrolase [Saccharospirillum sp.]